MTDAQSNMPAPDTTPAVPTDPAARDRELTQLYEHDPNTYFYQDGGRYATEHLAIRKAQQAAAEKADPPQSAEQTEDDGLADVDVDAIDLEADDAGEGEEPAEGEDAEPIDTSAYVFEPAEGEEVTESGQARITAFAEFAAKNDLAPEAYQGAIAWYNDLVKQEQTRLADADKDAQKASIEALGGREAYASTIETAKSVLRTWPKELADAVRSARTSDGTRLALMPEFVRALASMGDRQGTPQPPQDRTQMLQAELAAIDAAMHEDVANLYRPWKGGKLATDRKLEIARELDSISRGEVPNVRERKVALAKEERELNALRKRDPQMFAHGSWPGARSPADRLAAIQAGRAA